MCSLAPIHLPPPPPGFQIIYVPPTIPLSRLDNYINNNDSLRPNDTSPCPATHSNSSTGPSTPPLESPLRLPTPSKMPMSNGHDGDHHIATDHDCVLRRYEMKMRQEPVQARMCGVGEKSDRRPVDPTPIIQLKVIDGNGEDITPTDPRSRNSLTRPSPGPGPNGMTFMQNPYYFLFACLVGGDEQEDELHVIDDGKTRFLTGTPVSSLYHLKDLDNSDAAFFVFPDLGVRKEGRYKLKLTLFEIVDQEVYYCTTMCTSTFSVYSAKKFPGMSKATDLSKSFAEQGLKIRVRKDPRQPAARASKAKRKSDAAESEEDAESRQNHHAGLPQQQQQSQHQRQQHQSKRSRGASLGYPHESDKSGRGYHQPPSPHEEPAYHHYPPPSLNGYPHSHGYHPNYPPPGHHMPPPPPPPPSSYEPYRGHPAMSPNYPPGPGYPPQYHGSGSGRPVTHPAPAPGPSNRHHQSLPPPGYGPPEHPNFQLHHHHQQQQAYHPPPSAYQHHPGSPYGDRERTGVPWPQDRRGTYPPQDRQRERDHAQDREREHEYQRERERYMSSTRGQAHQPRVREAPRPLSPRSRTSPTRGAYGSVQPSPTLSATSAGYRPSSSGRDTLHSPNVVTLPPLSMATTPRHRQSQGLPPIITSAERDRDELLNQRSGSQRGSRNASPTDNVGTPLSAGAKTDRMKLHNIVD
ncbi:uncharacterized protein IL334_002202 [Kwoniella shivajii]|uniref:Velvet domain-containing protein n=1 Tax=Kwoniella shivajii TaxID=564305 RepID=A0ABZ1CU27_9TREE|nr:hypothetical protein IL334_002202 [Kwoniella shivajii]